MVETIRDLQDQYMKTRLRNCLAQNERLQFQLIDAYILAELILVWSSKVPDCGTVLQSIVNKATKLLEQRK